MNSQTVEELVDKYLGEDVQRYAKSKKVNNFISKICAIIDYFTFLLSFMIFLGHKILKKFNFSIRKN